MKNTLKLDIEKMVQIFKTTFSVILIANTPIAVITVSSFIIPSSTWHLFDPILITTLILSLALPPPIISYFLANAEYEKKWRTSIRWRFIAAPTSIIFTMIWATFLPPHTTKEWGDLIFLLLSMAVTPCGLLLFALSDALMEHYGILKGSLIVIIFLSICIPPMAAIVRQPPATHIETQTPTNLIQATVTPSFLATDERWPSGNHLEHRGYKIENTIKLE
ncbi:hypothetical protein [Chromobacterium haemolyticum]|uniref:hypothetical protein n=1 Tax=Chromobacterium haemolyticum TaxID=394935 RepID=UPI00244B7B15|nr:hypothetical protein [Chromobacterium haemolyticum]MDH0344655.1 hypothetical protein [Chromobacterium haemolyticum]